jgi:hypothetical protein
VYAYEVSPRQTTGFVGGELQISAELEAALDAAFDKSNILTAPAVSLNVDTSSPTRSHAVRDQVFKLAFDVSGDEVAARSLAARLGSATDNRSKASLLIISVHSAARGGAYRVLLWTFPQQSVFNLKTTAAGPEIELLEAFNRDSTLRKAAMFEGPRTNTGMLTARVLDFQTTSADRDVADLWIVSFLNARLQMSDAEGTQLLARALRAAHGKTRDDQQAQDDILAAIATLRATRQRWSIQAVADTLGQVASSALTASVRPEERTAVFGIESDRFDELVQYRRFRLSNGVLVSAPFVEINVDGGVQVTEVDGKRVLKAEGEIEDEQVRMRG